MAITVLNKVPENLCDAAWHVYVDSFEELRATAVQRHLMYRREFDEVMSDARVQKYIDSTPETGALKGLATVTNDLLAVPLISPEYFENHFTSQYRERRIWYVGFVAVSPSNRGSGTFERLVREMCESRVGPDDIVAADICRRNTEMFSFPDAIYSILQDILGGVAMHRLDEQVYFVYEFEKSDTPSGMLNNIDH